MVGTVRGSIGQQRTVACKIGQQELLLEQFRQVENSTKQLGTVSCKKDNKIMVRTVWGSIGQHRTV